MKKIALLLSIICYVLGASAGPNKDLRCNDWLNGDYAAYDRDSDRMVSYDAMGVKGVCKDFFPTWGERFKFERSNDDPFTVTFDVIRQYCWARNFMWGGGFQGNRETSKTYCGGCRMNFLWCKGGGWTPPKYSSWGHTYSTNFNYDELNSGDQGWSVKKVMKHGGTSFHHVCLRLYVKGEKFKHDQDKTHDKYLPKICAYVVNVGGCNSPLLNWGHALIGCIDQPAKPGPPVFNHVMVGSAIAFVDQDLTLSDYLNMGSTFDQPMIELTNGLTGAEKKTLKLRYKFPNDSRTIDGTPRCGFFPDEDRQEYCAEYSSSTPDRVCACLRDECANGKYLGCAPRPNLEQSGLKVKTEYAVHESIDGRLSPAIGVQIIKVDSAGNETGQLPLTVPPKVVREYYKMDQAGNIIVQRDSVDVYGVTFGAMIPEISGGDVQYIRVGTPEMVYASSGCYHFAEFPLDDDRWPKYYVPAGNRDRTSCQCQPGQQFCTIPPAADCIDGGFYPHNSDAVDAYCPGLYLGPEDPGQPDSICVINDSSFDFMTQTDGLCAELKPGCHVSEYASPASGYATFPTQNLNPGESITGICDLGTGFEPIMDYTNSIDSSRLASNPLRALIEYEFRKAFDQLKNLFDGKNMNIPPERLRNLEAAFGNLITVGNPAVSTPTMQCGGDSLNGTIISPCRLQHGCNYIHKKSYNFFGGNFRASSEAGRINGACHTPFVQDDGTPSIVCIKQREAIQGQYRQDIQLKIVGQSGYNIQFDTMFWDRRSINNPCQHSEY